jgi:hypothetical protein
MRRQTAGVTINDWTADTHTAGPAQLYQGTARTGTVLGGSHALPDSEFGSTPMPSPCRTTEDKPSMTQRGTIS